MRHISFKIGDVFGNRETPRGFENIRMDRDTQNIKKREKRNKKAILWQQAGSRDYREHTSVFYIVHHII